MQVNNTPEMGESASEGTYERNFVMYGMLIVVILCIIWLWGVILICLFMLGTLGFYFISEFKLQKKINSIIAVPHAAIPRTKFLLFSIIAIILSVVCFLIYNDSMPIFKVCGNPLSFTVTYERSLLLTVSFALAFLSLRLFLMAINSFSFIELECGFYGLIYRLLFIIRSLIVTDSWIKYFAEDLDTSFSTVFLSKKMSLEGAYLAVKALFMTSLLWDQSSSRSKYKLAKRKTLRKENGTCCSCGKPGNFVLQCGHCVCNDCLKSKISMSPFCPSCLHSVCKPVNFAFTSGYSSVASIFCCI